MDRHHDVIVTVLVELTESGLVRASLKVTNAEEAEGVLDIQRVSLWLPVPQRATHLSDMTGYHMRERLLQTRPFTVGTSTREGWAGSTGHDSSVWTIASVGEPRFRTSELWATHFAWSGNQETGALRTSKGWSGIGGAELLHPGEIQLEPGQSYQTPWMFGSYAQGMDQMAARVHEFLRARNNHPSSPRPVSLNTWEAVYFDQSFERLAPLAESAAAVGMERFVLDDGWFGARRDDTRGLGDWVVAEEVWPSG